MIRLYDNGIIKSCDFRIDWGAIITVFGMNTEVSDCKFISWCGYGEENYGEER